MATLVGVCGFEAGTVAGIATGNTGARLWDSASSPTVVTTSPGSGTYCLELTGTAAVRNVAWNDTGVLASGGAGVAVAGFRFYVPTSLPGSNFNIGTWQSRGSVDMTFFTRASDGRLCVQPTGGSVVAGPILAADTWYWVDSRFTTNTTTATLDWAVDGVAQTQATQAQTATEVLGLLLGWMVSQTGTVRYDDVVASVTSGDYPLGRHSVVLLKPDTSGTTAEIGTANATARYTTNGGGLDATHSSANILAAISEVPPTIGASASGVYQRTSGGTNAVGIPMTTYTLATGETITGVRVEVVGWSATATGNNVGLRAHDGSAETTLFAAADPNFDASTTTPAWLCRMYTPAGGWDQTKLSALVVRLGYSTDISPQPGAHAVYAEVAVRTPVTGTGAGTVGGLSGTASGTVTPAGGGSVSGTATGTVGGLSGAASGTRTVSATAAGVVGGLAGTGSGTRTVTGTAAGTTGGLGGTASGVRTVRGTAAGAVGGLAGAATGRRTTAGTAAGAVGGLSGSASAVRTVLATAAGTAGGLVGTGTGGTAGGPATVTGTATGTVGGASGHAAGVRTVAGAAAGTLGGLAGTSVAVRAVLGVATLQFGGLVGTAAGVRTAIGTAGGLVGGLVGAATVEASLILRPDTGDTPRPTAGMTIRPAAGTVSRPGTGTIIRPDTGTVTRP